MRKTFWMVVTSLLCSALVSVIAAGVETITGGVVCAKCA
jgi:hypothetical protein